MNALSGTDTEIRESLPPILSTSWCELREFRDSATALLTAALLD